MCISTDINFPKVSSRQVVANIIIAHPVATSRNYPMITVGHKCCVVVQTILSNIMPDMSPLTIICPCRTTLSQSWVITIHTDEGVTRVRHLISFTAKISHHRPIKKPKCIKDILTSIWVISIDKPCILFQTGWAGILSFLLIPFDGMTQTFSVSCK